MQIDLPYFEQTYNVLEVYPDDGKSASGKGAVSLLRQVTRFCRVESAIACPDLRS
jgi:hypothetical protein